MSAERMDSGSRLQVLQKSLDEVARELRLLRRRQQGDSRIGEALWQTACLVHWLAPGEPEAAIAFLQKQRPQDTTDRVQWTQLLEAAEKSTPEEERLRLTTTPCSLKEGRRLKRAQTWLQEFGLHTWIHNLNVGKSIAPVTSVVLQELERRVSAAPEPSRIPAKSKHRQQWLRRWRRRWGIRLARLLPGERLAPEACARKAAAALSIRPAPLSKSVGCHWASGGAGKSERRARGGAPGKKVCHLVAAKLGPAIVRPRAWGARKRPPFFSGGSVCDPPQATAMWTWSNFLHDQVPTSLAPLRINFDETAIRYFQDSRKGYLTLGAQQQRSSARSLTRQVCRSETRAMMSMATFICDDPAVQPLLPQVLLVNKKLMTEAETALAAALLPPGVHLWREDSAWTTGAIMVRLLTTLHLSLSAALSTRKVILSADAFRSHMTKPVFRTAARLGFFYFLVPSKMTWALQPCDTHVFALFKRTLEETVQAATAQTSEGRLSRPLLVHCVASTVETILHRRSWKRAFEDCGLVGTQATVSARTLAKLGTASLPPAERGLPSLSMLREIFPTRAWVPIDDVFMAFRPGRDIPGQPGPMEQHTHAPISPSPVDPRGPWFGRLRSSLVHSQEATESAGAAPQCPRTPPSVERETPSQPRVSLPPPGPRRRVVPIGHPLPHPCLGRAPLERRPALPPASRATSSPASSV